MTDNENCFAVDVLTFSSSHHALKAEKVCKDAGISVSLIPLPREISADCGVCLIVRPDMLKQAEGILESMRVPLNGVHHLVREGREARMWRRLLNP